IAMEAILLIFMALNMYLDVHFGSYSFHQLAFLTPTEARVLQDSLHRNFNQMMAVAFTTVAIAVPLTANMYSLKFLEFFIKDRVNAIVLTFAVFVFFNNTWIAYSIKDNFVPHYQLNLSLMLSVIGFTMLIPYLYYVFRFLHPETLLKRLEQEIRNQLATAASKPQKAGQYRASVATGMEHLANIAIRSLDRLDHSTAIESIQTLERIGQYYWKLKPRLSHDWFVAESTFFLGFSADAVKELSDSHSWME